MLAALSVPRDRWWAAWIGVSALGLMIEVAQGLTPYRAFEWMDFVADAVGAAIGVGIAALVRRTAAKPSTRSCARILYMTTLPLAEVRANLSKLVEEAERTHQRVEVTKNGRRAAVLMSADDYDSLTETLDILSDAEAMAAIRESDADIAAGRIYSLDEVAAELRARGILSS